MATGGVVCVRVCLYTYRVEYPLISQVWTIGLWLHCNAIVCYSAWIREIFQLCYEKMEQQTYQGHPEGGGGAHKALRLQPTSSFPLPLELSVNGFLHLLLSSVEYSHAAEITYSIALLLHVYVYLCAVYIVGASSVHSSLGTKLWCPQSQTFILGHSDEVKFTVGVVVSDLSLCDDSLPRLGGLLFPSPCACVLPVGFITKRVQHNQGIFCLSDFTNPQSHLTGKVGFLNLVMSMFT